MAFDKVDPQYRSCTVEAQRVAALAAKYGLDATTPRGPGSQYFTLFLADDSATVRISRHEPNYALRDDADIMVYPATSWAETAEAACRQIEAFFELDRPTSVTRYLATCATREANRAAKIEAAQAERLEASRQQAKADQRLRFRRRCAECRVTAEIVRAALSGGDDGNPCGIYRQVRAWARGLSVDEALEIVS